MKIGDEILLRARIIDNNDMFGPELKVEVSGFHPEAQQEEGKIKFWIDPRKDLPVLVAEKK